MYSLSRDDVTETFRAAVLKALDEAAKEAFPVIPAAFVGQEGATDADLPRLFKDIDSHVTALAARFDVALVA